MTVDSVAALREEIWDAGFRPVPVVNCDARCTSPGKRPGGPNGGLEWEKAARQDPPAALTWRSPHELNTGILCDGLRPIDIDVEDGAAVARIRAIADHMFGQCPVRIRNNSQRCLMLYRAAEGEPPKRKLRGERGSVEILGKGNQFVAYGFHPSGAIIHWVDDPPHSTIRESLPAITEQQVEDFFAEIAPILGRALETASETPAETTEDVRALIRELVASHAGSISTADELPPGARAALDQAIRKYDRLSYRWNGGDQDLIDAGKDASRSGRDMSLVTMLKGAGLSDTDAAIGLLVYEHGSAHDLKKHPTQASRLRYVARTALRSGVANMAPDTIDLDFDPETGEIFGDKAAASAWDFGAEDGEAPKAETPEPPKKTDRSLRLLTMAEVESLPPTQWLIDGLIPAGGLVIPYGPPKVGKTFVVLSWALHIAAGKEWGGKAVRQGAVVYVVGEGLGGFASRLVVMREAYGIHAAAPLYIVPRAVNFRNDAEVSELGKLISATVPANVAVALIVIDTLARAMPGVDENSAQEVGLVISRCDRLKEHFGCTVMPVHHAGKDAERGMRGTTAIHGAIDASFVIKAAGKGKVRVINDNQKDGEPARPVLLTMETVSVGFRNSLVPRFEEEGHNEPGRPRDPEKPDRAEMLVRVLLALNEAGLDQMKFADVATALNCAPGRAKQELAEMIPFGRSAAALVGAYRVWISVQGTAANAPRYVHREPLHHDR